jgi:hypothetical protein
MAQRQAIQVVDVKRALLPHVPLKIWWERSRVGSIPTLGTIHFLRYQTLARCRDVARTPWRGCSRLFAGTNLAHGMDAAQCAARAPDEKRSTRQGACVREIPAVCGHSCCAITVICADRKRPFNAPPMIQKLSGKPHSNPQALRLMRNSPGTRHDCRSRCQK